MDEEIFTSGNRSCINKKGMWMTLAAWFIITVLLAIFTPSVRDYEVSSIDSLPDDAKSVIAQKKSIIISKTMKEFRQS